MKYTLTLHGNHRIERQNQRYRAPKRLLLENPTATNPHTTSPSSRTKPRTPHAHVLLPLGGIEIDRDELLDVTTMYGVEATMIDLLDYLDIEGGTRAEGLPAWEEFSSFADEYEAEV